MGYEVAEQLGWELPDAIFYPTGGGVGMIGMWKAFAEMEALGWIDSKRPKMIAVQAEGCQPIVRALREGQEQPVLGRRDTVASGLRVPKPLGDRLTLQAVRESGGTAIAVIGPGAGGRGDPAGGGGRDFRGTGGSGVCGGGGAADLEGFLKARSGWSFTTRGRG